MADLIKLFSKSTNERATAKAKILLVDDTPANLLSLRAILESPDYDLVEARSGEETLEQLQAQEFAVVLLDMRMPGLSGFDTAKLIRADERSRHTPIIFLTADDIDRAQIEEGYVLGAVDLLVKPLQPVVLQAKVRGFIDLFLEKERAKQEAEQLRLLVQGTTEYAIFMLDPQGRVATWNDGAERLKGYKAEEIIGQHFSKFYPQEAVDRGWPDEELRRATAEGRIEDEGWRIRKDGSQFWANVVITAFRDERGQLRGFSKITRDLTTRKHAEESLHRSEERFRLLVEMATDYAIFLLDPQGYVASWNLGAERIKGYQAEEIIGQHFSRFYPQEALERDWPAHELKVAVAEGRFEDEGWRVRKDGSQFWANVVITALYDKNGDFQGFSKITRDLTERKKAEENARRLLEESTARRVAEENSRLIREQRERLHVTLESIGDAVISTDAEGRIEFLNPIAQELVGWTNEEAARRNLSDVFHIINEQTGLPVENPALRALKEGVVVGLANHTILIARDGQKRPIDDSAAPIRDAEGKVVGSVLVFRDISQRRRNEERLREQQEWLRVTLASIGDAVIATDVEGRMTFLNGVAEELTGWHQADAQGQPLTRVFSIVNEQTRLPVENPVERVLRKGAIVGLANHTVLISRDGRQRPIDDAAAPIRSDAGKLIGVVLTFRDVTEQRQAEQELRQSEARKTAILETALDCIITIDHEGKVIEFNPAAEKTFGYKRHEIINQELCQFIIPASLRERHRKGIAQYLATGEGPVLGKRLDFTALRADGTEFPIELTITRIPTEGPPLFTAYLRDISDLQRAEQRRNLRLAVTEALSEATDVEAGVGRVLRAVCENLGWDVGFFWSVNQQGDRLVCRASWHLPEVPMTEFEAASCSRTFEKGQGLPGRVWASQQPAWILDLLGDTNFPRLVAAAQHGLHTGFACPILIAGNTLGVIEFFTRRSREADADVLETMGTIAGSIGQFIERKIAEDEVRRSERELADFFEHATIGLHWVGPDGIVLRANRAELDLLGYSREEYVGRPIADFHADNDVICDILKRLKAGEKLTEYPARLKCKDGSIKDVLIDSSVLWRDDTFVHTRCFTRDVTERKRAETALRESERRFRQLADAMPQIVWTARPDGNIDYLNHRWTEFTGLPENVGNDAWGQITHPDEVQAASERWRASMQTGAPFEMEMRLLDRRQQTYRWHLIRTVAVHDEAGNVTRWFGTGTDIHEQKQAEESSRFLAEASAALAGVVDYESTLQKVANLAVPYFADWSAVDVVNDDGSLRRLAVAHRQPDKVSFVHELMREYPPDPQSPGGAAAVLRTKKPELTPEITDEMLVQAAKDERHLRLIRSLGLKSYMCVPLTVSGNALGVLIFATAESGRKYTEADLALATDLAHRAGVAVENTRLYQALREGDRRKDEFLATLAHELRNPLAPIRNSLEILKMPRVDTTTAQQTRDMMERQVHHLVRLVDDLLDVSRVMRGKIELRKEPVELATVLARAVETAKPLIEVQGHQLEISVSKESLLLDADPVRLAQVVGNLLTNSAKYTEANGHIWLTAQREEDKAVVRVRDTGIGIAPDMLPHVFELFVQADHTSTKAQGGLGIGLTLVKNLVEMHGGGVEARSAGLGKGCEFVVRLPLMALRTEKLNDEEITEPNQSAPKSGHRLLVVDDNQDAAMSLALLLKLQGHEVRVANDGQSALEIASTFRPSVIFLDIGMPVMDGYEVARRLRQQPGLEKVVLVALTGWGQKDDRRRSREAGFDHHLVKPAEAKMLEALLAELTESKG
jgi:PAS domain S-box-containing protein